MMTNDITGAENRNTERAHTHFFAIKFSPRELNACTNIIECLKLNINIISARVDLVSNKNTNDLV